MIKKRKKILCLCLIFMQLFMLSAPLRTVFADEAKSDAAPSDELLVMQNLGFIPEDFEESDEIITRAEGVSYISDALSILSANADQVFTDVDAKNKYFKSIYSAYISGLAQGVGDRKFAPDEPLTYEQLQKLTVDALGYKNVARYRTYERIASDLDLYDGVSLDSKTAVSRKNYVKMLYNMFHAEYAELSEVVGDSVSFKTSGEILLNMLDIYYVEGILRGKNEFSLSGSEHNDGITVDYDFYHSDKRYDDLHLGANVRMYYTDANGPEEVLYVYEYENKIYEVDSEDVKSVTNAKLEFWSGANKTKVTRLNISKTADILVNNAPMSPFNPDAILNSDDNVYLIDNNSDGTIDCVLAWKSDVYFAAGVYENGSVKKIIDKRGKPSLDLSKYDTVRVITAGSETSFDSIPQNSVVTVYASDYSATLYVSTVKFGAEIKAKSDDEITINNTVYKKDKNYDENMKNGYSYTPELTTGLSAMFYLDFKNRIVAADTNGYSGMQYGVLLASKSDNGLNDKTSLKIYVPNVGIRTFDTADKIIYNGKRQNAVDAMEKFKNSFDSSEVKSKVIMFNANADSCITKLVNAYGNNGVDKINLSCRYNTKTYWRAESRTFAEDAELNSGRGNTQYGIANGGAIVIVPKEFGSEFNESFDDDDFSTISVTDLVQNGDYTNTEIYDADNAHGAKLVLARVPVSDKYSAQSEFMCVNSVSNVIADDGNEYYAVTGLWQKTIQTFYVENEEDAKNIKSGDIIHPLFDAKSRISSFKVVFRFADSRPTGSDVYLGDIDRDGTPDTPITQYSAKHDLMLVVTENSNRNPLKNTCTTLYGNLMNLSGAGLTASYTDNTDGMAAFYNIPGYIIVCEKLRDGKIQYRIGTFAELTESGKDQADGSEIFLNLRNQRVTQLIMFK